MLRSGWLCQSATDSFRQCSLPGPYLVQFLHLFPQRQNFLPLHLEQNKMPRKLLQERFFLKSHVVFFASAMGSYWIYRPPIKTPPTSPPRVLSALVENEGGVFLARHLLFWWVMTRVIINYTHFVGIKLHASMYSKFGGDSLILLVVQCLGC